MTETIANAGPLQASLAARIGKSRNRALAMTKDPVIEFYKKDVDRTLIRENLKLSVEERFEKFLHFMRLVEEMRRSAKCDNDRKETPTGS